MNADDMQRALGRLEVHWPHKTWTEAQLAAWRDTMRRFDLPDVLAVLDALRAGDFARFAPDPGAALEALQGLARRRARARAEGWVSDGSPGTVAGRGEALEAIRRCKGMLKEVAHG